MPRYIDADKLKEHFSWWNVNDNAIRGHYKNVFNDIIDQQPTVQVRYNHEARWMVFDGDLTPSCSHCGMAAPSARYRRKDGVNAHELTEFCPSCGAKITAMDECKNCPHAEDGKWQDNGVCFACREKTWLPGQKHNDYILKRDEI